MSLTVLSVAYPFARVAPDTAGGAEQVLAALDRALVRAGHRSVVVAQAGSRVAGTLVPVRVPDGEADDAVRRATHAAVRAAIARVLAHEAVDVVHLHGLDFAAYLPPPGPPALATLHLPVACYPPEAFRPARPRTYLHCVSASQHRDAPLVPALLPPIANGVDLAAFAAPHVKRGFALMLARICPEKGIHLALDAARAADLPLLIGGEVFPYADHRRYFAAEVVPRLDARRRWLGALGPARKRRLLGAAHCLVVASTIAETSSLVAREALAAGTPVVALDRGALAEAVDHGRTGFLVQDPADLAAAMRAAAELDPAACRAAARARFSDAAMIAAYLALYAALAAGRDPAQGRAAA
jgi:glycosyltransferase involved in cell wall biosynthesis